MAKCESCAALLEEFLNVSLVGDWETAEGLKSKISKAAKDANEIKRDIRTHLPRSLFLPVARNDLLELLHIQDRLAYLSKEISNLIVLRRLELPEELSESLKSYLRISLDATVQARKAINELDELLETGFRGKEAEFVESLVAELDAMDINCEESKTKLQKLVILREHSLPAVEAMFLYKLIDLIGDLAITAHRIGGRLLLLMAH